MSPRALGTKLESCANCLLLSAWRAAATACAAEVESESAIVPELETDGVDVTLLAPEEGLTPVAAGAAIGAAVRGDALGSATGTSVPSDFKTNCSVAEAAGAAG